MHEASSLIAPILSVRDLKVHFRIKAGGAWPWSPARILKAVDGLSLIHI